jgi:hypothetical protein
LSLPVYKTDNHKEGETVILRLPVYVFCLLFPNFYGAMTENLITYIASSDACYHACFHMTKFHLFKKTHCLFFSSWHTPQIHYFERNSLCKITLTWGESCGIIIGDKIYVEYACEYNTL